MVVIAAACLKHVEIADAERNLDYYVVQQQNSMKRLYLRNQFNFCISRRFIDRVEAFIGPVPRELVQGWCGPVASGQ